MVKDNVRSVKLGRLPALIKTYMNELDKLNDEMSTPFALAFQHTGRLLCIIGWYTMNGANCPWGNRAGSAHERAGVVH
jgi:hypothetical protein